MEDLSLFRTEELLFILDTLKTNLEYFNSRVNILEDYIDSLSKYIESREDNG